MRGSKYLNDKVVSLESVSFMLIRKALFLTDSCSCGCHERLRVGSQLAADIREGLNRELGITCCGGIAHNKLLSKLVAGSHKPNQQTTLFPENTGSLMHSLKSVRNIPGMYWMSMFSTLTLQLIIL